MTPDDSLRLIYRAIDEIRDSAPDSPEIEKSPETRLFGDGGALDSLALVGLIVAVEELLYDELDLEVTLADEKAMSQRVSPFRSISTLAEYVAVRAADA